MRKPDAGDTTGKISDRGIVAQKLKKKTHCQSVLEHLQAGHRLTFLDSLKLFRCRALSARISELKQRGHVIKKRMIKTDDGADIAEYYLEKKEGEQ